MFFPSVFGDAISRSIGGNRHNNNKTQKNNVAFYFFFIFLYNCLHQWWCVWVLSHKRLSAILRRTQQKEEKIDQKQHTVYVAETIALDSEQWLNWQMGYIPSLVAIVQVVRDYNYNLDDLMLAKTVFKKSWTNSYST